jgi:putative membrane protein insertion efficiency factor
MKRLLIGFIRQYQIISRALGGQVLLVSGCRRWPTCSDYSITAIEQYGPVRGILKSVIRLVGCNPFTEHAWRP